MYPFLIELLNKEKEKELEASLYAEVPISLEELEPFESKEEKVENCIIINILGED